MRKPLLAALLITALTASSSLANETQGNHAGRDFNKEKQKKLERLDKLRQCIAASQDFEAMKSCKNSINSKSPNKA
jgi:hypothetical protein